MHGMAELGREAFHWRAAKAATLVMNACALSHFAAQIERIHELESQVDAVEVARLAAHSCAHVHAFGVHGRP